MLLTEPKPIETRNRPAMLPDQSRIHYVDNIGADEDSARILLDARSGEAYEEEHIPGSVNLCVYETAFPEKAQEQCLDKSTPIVVYGESAQYKAAELAAGRLQDLGYQSVAVLRGGIAAWKSKGGAPEGAGQPRRASVGPQRLALDLERSRLRWIGRNLSNQHSGEIALKSGFLTLAADGAPASGSVVVDMNSMTCIDIADSKLAEKLLEHLCSVDFFQTEKYPTAHFTATEFKRLSDKLGQPNYEMRGSIAVRGQEQAMALPITFAPLSDGYVAQANFDLDRTLFGALYGSDSVFERLGMHLVNNLIYLQLVAIFRADEA